MHQESFPSGFTLTESRLEILAVREKMDEYMQLTAELGEGVSKLKVELTYAKDLDEELSEPPDRVVPVHSNVSTSTREKHSRRQSTGTNASDTFFTSDDLRGGDELTRQGQDGVVQTVQPFFLVPPQLNRMSTNKASILKKKKTNGGSGGGGDDPDDDPDDERRGIRMRTPMTRTHKEGVRRKAARLTISIASRRNQLWFLRRSC